MIGLRTLLGGKFGIYIVGGSFLAGLALGYKYCDNQHGAAEAEQAKTQIRETQAQIERVTQEGRHVEETISERRRDADRHVREVYRSDSFDRPVEPDVGCVWLAALEGRPSTDCEPESAGEVPGVRGSSGTASEGG